MRLSPDFGREWLTDYKLAGAEEEKVSDASQSIERIKKLDKSLSEKGVVIEAGAAEQLLELYSAIPEEIRQEMIDPGEWPANAQDIQKYLVPYVSRVEKLSAPLAKPFPRGMGMVSPEDAQNLLAIFLLHPILQIEFFRAMAEPIK